MRAVIEYSGRLTSTGESQGHYFCDVKDKETNLWFRTNDNSHPVKIGIAEVSKNGYAFLFQSICLKWLFCEFLSMKSDQYITI